MCASLGLRLVVLGYIHVGCLAEFIKAAVPGAPQNLSLANLYDTAALLQWEATYTDSITRFKMDLRLLPHDGPVGTSARFPPHPRKLVTDVDGRVRTYLLRELFPESQYEAFVIAYNTEGMSNRSNVVTFKTLSATQESEMTVLSVHPGEVLVVALILVAWIGAIALFLNKWGKIRIVEHRASRWKHEPKNLDTIKVVKKSSDSVIHKNYSSGITKNMAERNKRQVERMNTMPNIKLNLDKLQIPKEPGTVEKKNDNGDIQRKSLSLDGATEKTSLANAEEVDKNSVVDVGGKVPKEPVPTSPANSKSKSMFGKRFRSMRNPKQKNFARTLTSPVFEVDETISSA